LNFNDYATRITIAQGLLDLAIFSANGAQLRRVVIFGTTHKFYYFLMISIIFSICLQVLIETSCMHLNIHVLFLFQILQAFLMFLLAMVFDLYNEKDHLKTKIVNNILLVASIVSVATNVLITTFDI
jgi:Ninjurin